MAFNGTLYLNQPIENLHIDREDENAVGLVGRLTGTVDSVGMTNVSVTGDRSVGAVVGENAGTVQFATVGGGSVSGTASVGGVVGTNEGDVAGSGTNLSVSASEGTAGGVIGISARDVNRLQAHGDVDGGDEVGGVIGLAAGNVTNSWATGTVTGDDYVGGVVGSLRTVDGDVWMSDMYATGNVTGEASVGGIAGSVESWSHWAYAIDGYAAGSVEGTTDVGGVVGSTVIDMGIDLSGLYWDVSVSVEDGIGDDGSDYFDPVGLETEEMTGETARERMAELDFTDTWMEVIEPEDDYPLLEVDTETATNLSVETDEDTLAIGQEVNYTVTASYADGSSDDVLPTGYRVNWSVLLTDTTSIEGLESGDSILEVFYSGQSASTNVTVLPSVAVTDCGELNDSGSYLLTEDLSQGIGDCLTVNASDVHIDGGGHTIETDSTNGYGIDAAGDNVTIENVTIDDFHAAVRGDAVSDLTVRNVTVKGGTYGLSLFEMDGFTVSDTDVNGTWRSGIQVYDSPNGILENVAVTESGNEDWEQLLVRGPATTNVSLEQVTVTDGDDGVTGVGIRQDASDISVWDLDVADNEVNLEMTDVSDLQLQSVVHGPAETQHVETNTENVSAVFVRFGDQHLEYQRAEGDLEVSTIDRPVDVPEGLTSTGNYLEIDGTYAPDDSLWLVEHVAVSATDFSTFERETLTFNVVEDDEWEPIETVHSFPQLAYAELNPSGEYGLLGSTEVESLEVYEPTLTVGEESQLLANATYSDGTVVNVTAETDFATADADIVTVSPDGAITGESAGEATVTATFDGETAEGTVTVTDGPEAVPETYYGTISINGEPAPEGTVVESVIDGEIRGNITVDEEGVYGGPDLLDERLTAEGYEHEVNETVSFLVTPPDQEVHLPGPANETSSFEPEATTQLNLSASLEEPLEPVYEATIPNDGTTYTVATPGPLNETIADMFPGGYDGLQTFWIYDDGWVQVYDETHTLDALDVLVMTTTGEGPAEIDVSIPLAVDTVATNATLEEGWNLVGAPARVGAEDAFATDETLLVLDRFDHATAADVDPVEPFSSYVIGSLAWGASVPTVSPFGGYFVYADAPTEIEPVLSDIPHKQAADEVLGIE